MRSLLLLPLLLSLGCGSETAGDATAPDGDTTPATSGQSAYDASLSEDPCSMLTPEMAAEVLNVSTDAIQLDEIAMQYVSGACVYEVIGGTDDASFVVNEVAEDAEAAAASFERQFRAMTDLELDATAQNADQALDEMEADGQIDTETADAASGAGDLIAGMASAISYEALSGVGDQAVVSLFKGQFNDVSVRDGNLIFNARASVSASPEALDKDREPSIALARAIANSN